MILIVEDEFMLAFGMEEALRDGGYDAISIAGRVAKALRVLDGGGVTMAFVDLNLGRETSQAVIERLRETAIPFVVCTAYAADQLPDFVGDAPVIHKPVGEAELVAAARSMANATA